MADASPYDLDVMVGSRVSMVHAGFFAKATWPSARTLNCSVGSNDIYTVPVGRKAVFFDAWISNFTAGTVGYYAQIKIGGTYYRISTNKSEATAGIGHNIGLNGVAGIPIVLNAGESLAINSDTAGATFWLDLIEFDAASPIARADITSWSVGYNTLLTMPSGKSIGVGIPGVTSANNPSFAVTGFCYMNGSGTTRTIVGPYIVPSGGSPSSTAGSANQFGGSNSVINTNLFCKWFPGGLAAGDTLQVNSDATTAGQYMWMNYWLV